MLAVGRVIIWSKFGAEITDVCVGRWQSVIWSASSHAFVCNRGFGDEVQDGASEVDSIPARQMNPTRPVGDAARSVQHSLNRPLPGFVIPWPHKPQEDLSFSLEVDFVARSEFEGRVLGTESFSEWRPSIEARVSTVLLSECLESSQQEALRKKLAHRASGLRAEDVGMPDQSDPS